jgi:hypothetical protein
MSRSFAWLLTIVGGLGFLRGVVWEWVRSSGHIEVTVLDVAVTIMFVVGVLALAGEPRLRASPPPVPPLPPDGTQEDPNER